MANALQIVQKYYPKVTQVKDATKSLEIEVEMRDIKSSSVRNHKECALAHACRRQENVDGVIISVSSAYVVRSNIAYRYQVTEAASREIVSFDRDSAFMPGIYKLSRPYPTNRIGVGRVSTNTRVSTRNKLRRRHITEGIRAHM
jgi:hypothetical protein